MFWAYYIGEKKMKNRKLKSKEKILSRKGATFPKGLLSLEDVMLVVKSGDSSANAGAIFSFTGVVRSSSLEHHSRVKEIEIEGWEEEADRILDWLAQDVEKLFQLVDCRIYHAIGRFRLNEEMVYIVTASAHRKEGYEALMHAINRYKEEVPLWKKEIYEDGTSKWVSKKKWKRPHFSYH